jgi:DNA repair exonuclease SbcCD ATPase subunit
VIPQRIRRSLVLGAVIGSLALGVATVRASAAWTAVDAPMSVAPISVQELAGRLAEEQSRSADLQRRLLEMEAASADLTAAMDLARERIATDAETAADLTSRLAQAKARLKTLEASIARSRAALAKSPPPSAPPSIGGGGYDDEHEAESDG